ncbi:hypothetical protein EJC49_07035 [Aquibium carbonis]|uniref:Uncharacterized protein n=1 Tax=Aquibium carbonis TaxID=2495581 RepID=A0A3S0AU74_9HYPH|nr:hypothetical protein EJC49_07035 [Aquibium carbonis]
MLRQTTRRAASFAPRPPERAQDSAPSRPPLACRPSPPRGGRSANASAFANCHGCKEGGDVDAADLPTCGGDVRQDRGGRDEVQPLRKQAS